MTGWMKSKCAMAMLCLLCGSQVGLAADKGQPIYLVGPEVAKLHWNARAIDSADVDRDGKRDVVLLNNNEAKIDILYQRTPGEKKKSERRIIDENRWEPVLEDARFEKASIVAGIQTYDLVLGDFNHDGRVDMAYTGNPDALTVRYQAEDGSYNEKRIIDIQKVSQFTNTLKCADVNKDGQSDLVVLANQSILLLMQSEKGELQSPVELAVSIPNSYGLQVVDLNQDGHVDLFYQSPSEHYSMRLRYGLGGGQFGPELMFRVELPGSNVVPVTLKPGAAPALVYVEKKTGLMNTVELDEKAFEPGEAFRQLKPRVYPTPNKSNGYALGDLNGDGKVDVVSADASGAQISLFLQGENGHLEDLTSFPSYAAVQHLAISDLDMDGKNELVVLSAKEKSIGVSQWQAEGRLSYPQTIAVIGQPSVFAIGQLDKDQNPDIAYVTEEQRSRFLVIDDAEKPIKLPLEEMRFDPEGMSIQDFNHDRLDDIMIFHGSMAARVFLQQADGAFKLANEDKAFKQGLLDRIKPTQFNHASLKDKQRPDMFISRDGYVRQVRMGDGNLSVVDQFNARDTNARIAASVVVDVDQDGEQDIVLVDEQTTTLQWLKRDENGVYRFHQSADMGRISLKGTLTVDFDKNGARDIILFGTDGFWIFPFNRPQVQAKTLDTHETTIENVQHRLLAVGDLNGDEWPDVVAIDNQNTRVMEVLTPVLKEKLSYKSRLHFKLFERDQFASRSSRNYEPREILVEDFTGDGRDDILLLIHDRLLLYPQEP